MTTDENVEHGKNAAIRFWMEKIAAEAVPPITTGAAGFPAEMLDSLHKRGEEFDVRAAVSLVKAGADLFAPLPPVRFSTYDATREIGKREATRLSSPTMFSSLMFRGNVINKATLRKQLPANLPAFPTAGLLSVFDRKGNPVVQDREITMLEYAALTTNDRRMYDWLLTTVDKSSRDVKDSMNRALDFYVTGGGIGKSQLHGPEIALRARNLVSLLLAGADPNTLRGRTADESDNPQVRMLQFLFDALGVAREDPRYPTASHSPDFSRIESAIEYITRPNPGTGALAFDIDYRNPETGRTFLHYAVEYAGPKTVETFLHAGADVDAEVDRKRLDPDADRSITALTIAEKSENDQVVAILQAWKAKRAVAKALGNVGRHRTLGEHLS